MNDEKKLRILFVHTSYRQNAGGEDTTVDAEQDLMKEKGHEVMLLLFDNARMSDSVLGKLKVAVSSVYNRRSALQMRQAIRNFNPDIIHIHNFFFDASPAVIIEAHSSGKPVVVTLHNYRLVCANGLLLRNHKVRSIADIVNAGVEKEKIPPVIHHMLQLQRKTSLKVLRSGIFSKLLMTLSYLTN